MVRSSQPKSVSCALFSAVVVSSSLWGSSAAWAGDPFRTDNARQIGDKTEAAFAELFEKGNYNQAKVYLLEAEAKEGKEPLSHAMRASLAYMEKDWETLQTHALKTLETAESLKSRDPLRGHLYLAVGHFLEGTYIFQTQGPLSAIPKLQMVFQHFDRAEEQDGKDPELNLLKGYLELMLAVNLPFSSPDRAIERFENHAGPDYLVERGIAVAYRDLNRHDRALESVEQSLQKTPDNPELYYLKAQILRQKSKSENDPALLEEAIAQFDKALEKADRLPPFILKQLEKEHQSAKKHLEESNQLKIAPLDR